MFFALLLRQKFERGAGVAALHNGIALQTLVQKYQAGAHALTALEQEFDGRSCTAWLAKPSDHIYGLQGYDGLSVPSTGLMS